MKYEEFAAAARKAGLQPRECARDHWQVKGALLVNLYPHTQRGMVLYIAGTTRGRKVRTLAEVFAAANTPPPVQSSANRDHRRGNYRGVKKKLLARNPRCHWCKCLLTFETATLEHIIPLRRGGLDNENNMALACEACNHGRGHDMPELDKKPTPERAALPPMPPRLSDEEIMAMAEKWKQATGSTTCTSTEFADAAARLRLSERDRLILDGELARRKLERQIQRRKESAAALLVGALFLAGLLWVLS